MAPDLRPEAEGPKHDPKHVPSPGERLLLEDRLSIDDFAALLDGDGHLGEDAHRRLAQACRDEPRFAPIIAEIDALAADAGLQRQPGMSLELNRRFDRLLASDPAQDPGEVIGFEHPEDMLYPELIRIADARIGRSSDAGELTRLKERLLRAEARGFEDRLQQIVRWLLVLSREGAARAVANALARYDRETAALRG